MAYYRRPAGIDRIIHHLERLALEKRMDSKDPDRTAYLISDHAQRFLKAEITELEITTMVEHFIENVVSSFYPEYAKMKKFIRTEFETAKWSRAYKQERKY